MESTREGSSRTGRRRQTKKGKNIIKALVPPESPAHVLFTVPQTQSWKSELLAPQSGSVWAEHPKHTATVLQDTQDPTNTQKTTL